MDYLKTAKVGDKVYFLPYGWGVISEIDNCDNTIKAYFKSINRNFWFRMDGVIVGVPHKSDGLLVFIKPEIKYHDSCFIRKNKTKVPPNDTLVKVYDDDGPVYAYSCGSLDNYGNLKCWEGGTTSRTVSDIHWWISYPNWEIVEDE